MDLLYTSCSVRLVIFKIFFKLFYIEENLYFAECIISCVFEFPVFVLYKKCDYCEK